MKYCPKCKKLYVDKNTHCSECKNKELVTLDNKQTPVFLCNCSAAQREIVMNALQENNIVCSYESQSQPNGMALEGYDILVPFEMYKDACQVAVGVGVMNPDEELLESIEISDENDVVEEFQEMSPAKRTTVRVLSAIFLIILFALVIFGVDYVMALIKNLFM